MWAPNSLELTAPHWPVWARYEYQADRSRCCTTVRVIWFGWGLWEAGVWRSEFDRDFRRRKAKNVTCRLRSVIFVVNRENRSHVVSGREIIKISVGNLLVKDGGNQYRTQFWYARENTHKMVNLAALVENFVGNITADSFLRLWSSWNRRKITKTWTSSVSFYERFLAGWTET
jgi:hypothetical protein